MLAAKQVPGMQERHDDTRLGDPREPGRRKGFRSSTVGEHRRPPGVPRHIPHPGLPGVALLSRAQVKRRAMRTAFPHCRHNPLYDTGGSGRDRRTSSRPRRANGNLVNVVISSFELPFHPSFRVHRSRYIYTYIYIEAERERERERERETLETEIFIFPGLTRGIRGW